MSGIICMVSGIFIIVGSLETTGWTSSFSDFLASIIGGNVFLGYVLLILFSILFSVFIDNVPYLATMLPVTIAMANELANNPSLFLFGLLIGASLNGNITPVGASANIVATGMLKKEGHEVKFLEFVKIGLPFTLSAVIPASIFVWFLWS
ncbi:MAG: anion permease [Spirochaetales bacterium]|nr:anion permease [Spirochaetales bacterium]